MNSTNQIISKLKGSSKNPVKERSEVKGPDQCVHQSPCPPDSMEAVLKACLNISSTKNNQNKPS